MLKSENPDSKMFKLKLLIALSLLAAIMFGLSSLTGIGAFAVVFKIAACLALLVGIVSTIGI